MKPACGVSQLDVVFGSWLWVAQRFTAAITGLFEKRL